MEPTQTNRLAFLKNKKVLITLTVFISLSVLIVVGSFYLKSLQEKNTISGKYKPITQQQIASAKKNRDQVILSSLNSPQDANIASTYKKADTDTNYIQAYQDYLKTYNLIASRYNTTHKVAYKNALNQLVYYLRVFPQYNQKDLLALR